MSTFDGIICGDSDALIDQMIEAGEKFDLVLTDPPYNINKDFGNDSDKLTVEEFILLTMIKAKTDQILQNIAIATGKNKSVVMRMIDSLENKGLVKRTVNPEDRRENLLGITELGEYVVDEYHEIEKKFSDDLLKDIPAEKVDIFFEVIDEISKRADLV